MDFTKYKGVCFYHNDMDGKAAGYCVHKCFMERYGIRESVENYHMRGYADPFITDNIDKNTIVFIVDLSFTESTVKDLLDLCDRAAYVIWVDHHQSSLDLISNYMFDKNRIVNLVSLVENDGCGALLTYCLAAIHLDILISTAGYLKVLAVDFKKLTPVTTNSDYRCATNYSTIALTDTINESNHGFVPDWLKLIDDYDRWVKQYDVTDAFILGCDCNNTSLFARDPYDVKRFNPFWGNLSHSAKAVEGYIADGQLIMKYLNSRYKRELAGAFTFTLPNGTTILCKNGTGNSWNFCEEMDNYDAVCLFNFDGKNGLWRHSIYARKDSPFKAHKFCEKFGGGGHAGAAGFQSKYPIFTDIKLFEEEWKKVNND